MVCADTNCWIAFLAGEQGPDVQILDQALRDAAIVMAPVVLTELLSAPNLPAADERDLLAIPMLDILPEYWWRAGKLRASLVKERYRPKTADTLIAQLCLDHQASLLTRDRDFRPFAKHAGLALL